jgi:hypothetical protein
LQVKIVYGTVAVVMEEAAGIVGTAAVGPTVESGGMPGRVLVVEDDVDVGVDDNATPLEPEPHIPDNPAVVAIPEVTDNPEVADIAADIPDVAMVPDVAVATVDAVAGVTAPLSVTPPPS